MPPPLPLTLSVCLVWVFIIWVLSLNRSLCPSYGLPDITRVLLVELPLSKSGQYELSPGVDHRTSFRISLYLLRMIDYDNTAHHDIDHIKGTSFRQALQRQSSFLASAPMSR